MVICFEKQYASLFDFFVMFSKSITSQSNLSHSHVTLVNFMKLVFLDILEIDFKIKKICKMLQGSYFKD